MKRDSFYTMRRRLESRKISEKLFGLSSNKVVVVDPPTTSDAAKNWLAFGERDLSSDTIFARLADVNLGNPYPCDPDDLRCCLLLLEAVPEFFARFDEMRAVSPQWAALVHNWRTLRKSLELEAPDWRSNKAFSAPNTYELMQSILK